MVTSIDDQDIYYQAKDGVNMNGKQKWGSVSANCSRLVIFVLFHVLSVLVDSELVESPKNTVVLRYMPHYLIWIKNESICNESSTGDLVNVTYSIVYRGKWVPTMEWKEHSYDGEQVLSDGVNTITTSNQLVTSTLVVKVPKISRYYSCATKFHINRKPRSTTAANVPDYNRVWTSSTMLKTEDTRNTLQLNVHATIVTVIVGTLIVVITTVVLVYDRRKKGVNLNGNQKMRSGNHILFKLIFTLLYVSLVLVHSELVEFPKNTVIMGHMPDDFIDMTCRSHYQSRLKWDVHKNDDSGNEVLYNGYFLRPNVKSYCAVITEEPGKCYLRLRNTAEVAQTYICVEPGTLNVASADLIWIKSDPICNKSSTEDFINLTCSIEFRGNWAPTMEWKEHNSQGGKVLSAEVNTVTISNQLVTSTLVVEVPKTITNYSCTTKFHINGKPRSTTAANVPNYNRVWTSPTMLKTEDTRNTLQLNVHATIVTVIVGTLIVVMTTLIVLIYMYARRKKGINYDSKGSNLYAAHCEHNPSLKEKKSDEVNRNCNSLLPITELI